MGTISTKKPNWWENTKENFGAGLSAVGSKFNLPEYGLSEKISGGVKTYDYLPGGNAYNNAKSSPAGGFSNAPVGGMSTSKDAPIGSGINDRMNAPIVGGDQYKTGQAGTGTTEADFQKAIDERNQARDRYTNQFNTYQQRQGETDQYMGDQYNTAVSRAGEKKGELTGQYGQAKGDLTDQFGQTKNTLASAYSARGLGDSSFSEKASTEADKSFQRNLSQLNKDEASQVKQVDDYLSDLAKQQEYKKKQISWQDFDTAEQYNQAIQDLDSEISQINEKKNQFRSSLDQYSQSLGGVSEQSANSMMQFGSDISGIYKSALPNATKKQLLSNIVLQAGSKNPERDADAYLQYLNYSDQISNAPDPDMAMKSFDDKLASTFNGWRPFGTN